MAPKKKSSASSPQSKSSCSCSLTRILTFVGILLGLFAPIVYLVEQNLEKFYIFGLDELHGLAQRGVAAHGNDTAKIVEYIVAELHENHPAHVNPKWNVQEEWVFNNAGGAMGGMYIIHASMCLLLLILILIYSSML